MITFVEGRQLPPEFKKLDLGHHYGDALTDIGNIVQKASPWDFLKGIFVDKPMAEQQAQIAIQQQQAAVAEQSLLSRQVTTKTLVMAGVGVLGLLALIAIARPRGAVAGYRKRRRSRRSRR